MTKIRKQKRQKKYRYNVNRKRLKKRRRELPSITCPQVKNAWEEKRSVEQNLNDMGLVYDTNKAFKIPRAKDLLQPVVQDDMSNAEEVTVSSKSHVAMELEDDAKAPRVKKFRLPNSQVTYLTYFIDKHGEDYKAMARDSKNYNQETWKQIRNKIKKFKGIPEQYNKYVESRKKQDSVESVP